MLHRSQLGLVALALAAAGCDASPDLEVGGYRLVVAGRTGQRGGLAGRVEVGPDGHLRGHPSSDADQCDEPLGPTELDDLVDALNRADALCRGDFTVPGCDEAGSYQFEVEGLAGAAAGWRNEFRYEPCERGNAALEDVLDVVQGPLNRAAAAGHCEGCAPELGALDCFDDADGARDFCAGPRRAVCDAAHAGELADCTDRSYVCDADLGFVPAATLALGPGVVRRSPGGAPYTLWITVAIQIDNRGAAELLTTELYPHLRFVGPDGTDLGPVDASSYTPYRIPGGVSGEYNLDFTARASAPVADASLAGLGLAVRSRPTELVDYGPPVTLEPQPWLP